ncbi:MAG TPA: hypothetical protein VHZ74_23585 [Bryobacteraceae bacterium]|jgi:hypothetical protein|nr:hypothetical protein [Bryobacteraceae bacterium]
MLMLSLVLATFLTTKTPAPQVPPPVTDWPVATLLGGPELAHAIKTDIEAIAGPGSVDISIDHETLFTVRVAVPGSHRELWTRIYDRELELYRLYPDLNFDFYVRLKPVPVSRRR